MRTFTKILACILAVLLTVTILPLSVFADTPAAEVSAAPAAASGYALEGNQPDGTVTVTLSLEKLRALLSDPTDVSKLVSELKDFVDVKGNVITLGELMELVPLDSMMELILGEDNSKVPELIERLGGMEVLLEMVDPTELIGGISKENMTALMTYVSSLDGFETVLKNLDELMKLNITIKDYGYVVSKYVNNGKLQTLAKEKINSGNIDSIFMPGYSIENVIDTGAFQSDVLDGLSKGTLTLKVSDIFDPDKLFADSTLIDTIASKIDAAAAKKLQSDLVKAKVVTADNVGTLNGIVLNKEEVKKLLDGKDSTTDPLFKAVKDALEADGFEKARDILTTAGKAAVLKSKIPADAVSIILGDAGYYNAPNLKAWVKATLSSDDLKKVLSLDELKKNDDIFAEAKNVLSTKSATYFTDEILTPVGLTKWLSAKSAYPSLDETVWLRENAVEGDYNKAEVINLLTQAADNKEIDLAGFVDTGALNDATIQTKLQDEMNGMTSDDIFDLLTKKGIEKLFEGVSFDDADIAKIRSNDSYYTSDKLVNLVTGKAADLDIALDSCYNIESMSQVLGNESIKTFLLGTDETGTTRLFNYVSAATIAGSIDSSKMDSYFVAGFDPYANDELVSMAFKHVDWSKVCDSTYVDIDKLLDILLTDGKSITDLLNDGVIPTMIQDEKVIDLNEVFEKIQSSKQGLTYFVDINKLINLIPASYYPTLFGYFDRTTLIGQLAPHWRTFFNAIPNQEKTDIAQLMVSSLIDKIDLVKLQGDVVAKESEYGALSIDVEQLIKTVLKLIPTPNDLANLSDDGVLIAFNVQVKYQTQANETKNKNVDFRLVLENGVDAIRTLAEKAAVLKRYININVDGTNVAVELNVPVILEKIYARAAQLDGTPAQVALKEKLLSVEGMTGDELLTLISETPLSEIIDALDDVDLNAMFERAVNVRYAETVVDKFNQYAGTDFDLSSLGSIDDLIDTAIDGKKVPSIEKIVEKLSDKIGKDLESILEKVTKTVDQNAYVQKLLDRAAQIDKIAPYVEKASAEKIVDLYVNYKGYDPIHAVNEFVKDQIKRDVLAKFQSYDSIQTIYEIALNKVESKFKSAYDRAATLLRNLTKEDYESDNRFVALLQAYLPTRAINAFLNNGISRFYRGNGVFSTGNHSVTIPVEKLIDRVLKKVQSRVPQINSTITNMIRGMISVDSITVGGSLTVNFQNLRKVTFLNEDGTKLMITYLPIGVDPMKAVTPKAIEGKTALGWANESGVLVNKITGDQTLKALYAGDEIKTYNVTYWYYNGTELQADALEIYTDLKSGEAIPVLKNIPTPPADGKTYEAVYFFGKGIAGEKIADLSSYTVGDADIDITFAYIAKEEPPVTTYKVNYWFFNGIEMEEVAVQTFEKLKAGDQVPALTNIPGIPANFPPLDCDMVYYVGKGTTGANVSDPTTYTISDADLDFTIAYVPECFLADVSFTFEFFKDTDGRYLFTITLNSNSMALQILMNKLPGTEILKKLVIKTADGSIKLSLGENMLKQMKEKYPTAKLAFKADVKNAAQELTLETATGTPLFTFSNALSYTFDLLADGVSYNKDTFGNFPADMEISMILPAATTALFASNQKTFALYIEGGKVKEMLATTAIDATTNQATFHVDHFSEYAIVNEYLLTPLFPGASGQVTINGSELPAEGIFVPAGATLQNIGATLSENLGKRITTLKVNNNAGGEIASIVRKGNFTMPASAAVLTVNSKDVGFTTFWVVDETHIYDTQAEAETALATIKAPAGYEFKKDATGAYVWDNDLNPATEKKDVYRTLVLEEKVYTVTFVPGEGKANEAKNFTVSQIPTFVAPIGADVTGKVFTTWNLGDQTLTAILNDIVAGTKADGYSINAQYTNVEYKLVYADGTEQAIAYATDVNPTDHFTLAATDEIDEIFYVTGDGTRTKVAYGATFQMPATTVRIEITTKVKTLSVTLRNDGDGSSQTVNVADGAKLLIPVTVPAGQALTTVPANGTLVSIIDNGDGIRTIVYEVAKSTLGTDNTITYRTAAQSAGQTELAVGNKEDTPKGVTYEGAVASEQTAFVTATYAFATYKTTETRNSLLWLWILLIVLLVCFIIGLIYWLYIHGKIKGCFITVIVVFIVTIFLNICLAWANLILAIERLFTGRRKEDDFKAHGMEDPETEGTTEEEAPAEEAPAEEAPVEEAPAEEAPVEEAPAEEAPVEEAPVEEAPVEEATEDETKKTSEEEN